jgi:hypothetical protein
MADEYEKKGSATASATRRLIVGMAGVVTWVACFVVVMGTGVQTGRGTVLPHHVVVFQWITWILAIPWIWLIWLLRPILAGDGITNTFHFAVLLAFLWCGVVCWGLSRLLRWSNQKKKR